MSGAAVLPSSLLRHLSFTESREWLELSHEETLYKSLSPSPRVPVTSALILACTTVVYSWMKTFSPYRITIMDILTYRLVCVLVVFFLNIFTIKFELSIYQHEEKTVILIVLLTKVSLQADPNNTLDTMAFFWLWQQMNSETHSPVCLFVTSRLVFHCSSKWELRVTVAYASLSFCRQIVVSQRTTQKMPRGLFTQGNNED